jgi:protein TonB
MAYTDQKMSGGKIVAIVIVALIHAALGYAFVTGLAYQYVKKAQEKMTTFDVEPPPPPVVVTPQPAPALTTSSIIPRFQPTAPPSPPAPPAPPAPPPTPRVSQAAGLKGNPGQYFGADNYPPSAQREGAQGRVSAKLTIGTDGRVTDCSVTSSSGNTTLDDATCRISKARVRFTPAKDENGNAVGSSYQLNIRWVLPQE